jgi:4-amino-4-deoxy-L-arabinose transferase-like glycosyltransferase
MAFARIIGFALAAAAAYWVYQDAKDRNMNEVLWAVGTFLLLIIVLPLYLIMRKPKS